MDRRWGPEPWDAAGRISLSRAQGRTGVTPDRKQPAGPGPWGPVAAGSPGACLLSQFTFSLTPSPDPASSPVHLFISASRLPCRPSAGHCRVGHQGERGGRGNTRDGQQQGVLFGRSQGQHPLQEEEDWTRVKCRGHKDPASAPTQKARSRDNPQSCPEGLRGWSLTARHL